MNEHVKKSDLVTINGKSLVGDGDIEITGGSGGSADLTEVYNAIEGKQDLLVSGDNIKTINGQGILGEGDIEISQNLDVDASTLTPEQLDYLRDKQIKYGSWRCESIPATSYTAPSVKLPFFRTKRNGQLVTQNETDFLFKKGVHYSIDMSYSVLTTNGAILAIALVNTINNAIIGDCYKTSRINISGANLEINGSRIFTVDEDTVGAFKITYLSTSPLTVTLSEIKVNITEISSFDVSLKDLKINGKSFDENNNIDLEGLSTLSSPKVGVEILTERRHPTSGKPIYTKTINFGALPNKTTKSVPHNILDIEDINLVFDQSYIINSSDPSSKFPVVFPHPITLTAQWNCNAHTTNIAITTGSDRTEFNAIITIQYTKTTDTAESPVRLIGGNGNNGKSAYEVYVDNVPEGEVPLSEVEWLESLKSAGSDVDLTNIDGDILPDITQTRNIGSPTKRFKGIYVDEAHLSMNTLYIGETPILGTDDDTINIKADLDQSMLIKTSGLGITTLESNSGLNINTSGNNADIKLQAQGTNSKLRMMAQGGVEISSDITLQESMNILKNLTISGNLILNGQTFQINAETVTTKDNILTLNFGELGNGITAGRAGLQFDRGEAEDFLIVFEESDKKAKLGFLGSELEVISTRPWVQNEIATSIVKNITYTESESEPTNPKLGDEWLNLTTDTLYKRRTKEGVVGWYSLGGNTVIDPNQSITLNSGAVINMVTENGTKYSISIDDDGSITTTLIEE